VQGLQGEALPIVSTPYVPSGLYEPEDEVFVLLANNRSSNLFDQLTIKDQRGGLNGKNFWSYLVGLRWRDANSKLANEVNRKLEKTRNYVYCSERAHLRVLLKENIVRPPSFKPYDDPNDHVCELRMRASSSPKMFDGRLSTIVLPILVVLFSFKL